MRTALLMLLFVSLAIPAVAQTTVTSAVLSSEDDAFDKPSGWPGYSHTAGSVYVGRIGQYVPELDLGSGVVYGGWRFVVDIPAGAAIESAHLEFTQRGWGHEVATTLAFEDAASPASFSSGSSPADRWARRSMFETAWTWQRSTPDSVIRSPSLKEGVQELVDEHGHLTSIVLLESGFITEGSQYHEWYSFDGDPGKAARLVVTYSLGPQLELQDESEIIRTSQFFTLDAGGLVQFEYLGSDRSTDANPVIRFRDSGGSVIERPYSLGSDGSVTSIDYNGYSFKIYPLYSTANANFAILVDANANGELDLPAESESIGEGERFALRNGSMVMAVFEYEAADSIDGDSPQIEFTNLANGNAIARPLSSTNPITKIYFGGSVFSVYNASSMYQDDFRIIVDLNGDGIVGSAVSCQHLEGRMSAALGSRCGDVAFDAAADVNDDGIVSSADLSLLASNYDELWCATQLLLPETCPAPTVVVHSCIDGDGGVNSDVKGSIEYVGYDINGNVIVQGAPSDMCTTDYVDGRPSVNGLREYYCDSGNETQYVTVECSFSCSNGRCMPPLSGSGVDVYASHDAYHQPSGWPGYNDDALTILAGQTSGPIYSGYRFSNVNIPAGATITEAYVEFTQSGWGYQVPTLLSFEDAKQSSSFSLDTSPFDRWSKKTAWGVEWRWGKGAPGAKVITPSLVEGLQQLVNTHSGITDVTLLEAGIPAPTSQNHAWESVESNPQATRLHVKYSVEERSPLNHVIFNSQGLALYTTGAWSQYVKEGDSFTLLSGNNDGVMDASQLNAWAATLRSYYPTLPLYAATSGIHNVQLAQQLDESLFTGLMMVYEPNQANAPEFTWNNSETLALFEQAANTIRGAGLEAWAKPSGRALSGRDHAGDWDYGKMAQIMDGLNVQLQGNCKRGEMQLATDDLMQQYRSRGAASDLFLEVTVASSQTNGVSPQQGIECSQVAWSTPEVDRVMIWTATSSATGQVQEAVDYFELREALS